MRFIKQTFLKFRDIYNAWPLTYFIAISLVVRFLFNFNIFSLPELALQSDSGGYLHLGKTLLSDFAFPSLLRTPGYPALISLTWLVTFTHSMIAVVIAQMIMDSLVPVIISKTNGFFQDTGKETKTGALLYALNPLAIYYSGKIMSESLFVFFLALSLYLIKKTVIEKREGWKNLFLTVMIVSTTVLTRPVGLGFYIILFVLFLWIFPKQKKITLQVAAGVAIILVAWMGKNYRTHDQFIISTAGNYNLYIFGQNSYAGAHGISYAEAEEKFKPGLVKYADERIAWRDTKEAKNLGVKLIFENKAGFLESSFIGALKTALQPAWGVQQINLMLYKGKYEIQEGSDLTNIGWSSILKFPYFERLFSLTLSAILLWSYGMAYLFIVIIFFVFKLKYLNNIKIKSLLILAILFFILIAGPLGFSRFRYPAEMLILI
ncbi:MAG: hypothetical protein AB7T22_15055 [Calditrichaceae bacterium]